VKVDRNCCTSRAGVFAAGDVTDTIYKQIVISAGEGAKAALSAYNYLQQRRGGGNPIHSVFLNLLELKQIGEEAKTYSK